MAIVEARTVYIIDDDEDVAALLEALVASHGDYDLLGSVRTPKLAGPALCAFAPDVVLVGEHRDGFDPMATLTFVRTAAPDACIVLLADLPDPITLLDALARGANTVLSSGAGWCELMPALDLLLGSRSRSALSAA